MTKILAEYSVGMDMKVFIIGTIVVSLLTVLLLFLALAITARQSDKENAGTRSQPWD
jgi:hypothetical protein